MAVTNTPIFPQALGAGHVQIANADASNLKTIYTAGSNGSKIVAVIAAGNDTSSRDLTLGITSSSVFYELSTYTLAITGGTVAGTPAANLFTGIIGLPIDNDGQPYVFLKSGETLQVKSLTTVTSGKTIEVSAFGSDF